MAQGLLPAGTHYAVLPDPDGKRVGSGGATFHVLKYIAEKEQQERDVYKRQGLDTCFYKDGQQLARAIGAEGCEDSFEEIETGVF